VQHTSGQKPWLQHLSGVTLGKAYKNEGPLQKGLADFKEDNMNGKGKDKARLIKNEGPPQKRTG